MKCTLEQKDLLWVTGDEHGTVLRCLRGTVWVTVGDGVDYLVNQGGQFRVAPAAAALVEALGQAEVCVEPSERKTAATVRRSRVSASVAAGV